jgi:Domain of unknown function (DUF6285)
MPRSIPDSATLLRSAVNYLEGELIPTLSGYHRFQTRVAANVLNIVRRELEMRESLESAERARLKELVGHDGSVETLNSELCDLIRTDRIDLNDPSLRSHLKQSLADALSINNPKWSA